MLKGNHDIVIYSKRYIHHLAHFWHRAPKIHYPAVLLTLITILFLWLLKIFASRAGQWNKCKLKSPRFSFFDRKLRPLWKAFDFCFSPGMQLWCLGPWQPCCDLVWGQKHKLQTAGWVREGTWFLEESLKLTALPCDRLSYSNHYCWKSALWTSMRK